ncbi:MAG: dTMP kinase [Spirochaetaceae bacterium]|jgi:dTMP kinase|nr:dTMP kinase [Spirochaetaceae bacterium]
MDVLKNFIVFEGGDGSGTSTALARIKSRAAASGLDAFFTAEPTDRETGILLRGVLSGKHKLSAPHLACLFAADRAVHLFAPDGIIEACKKKLVFCDRYVLSSIVYQGIECGEDAPKKMNAYFPAPEKLFFFDLDAQKAISRIKGRDKKEIFETLDFQKKAREAYLKNLDFCRSQGSEVFVLDAGLPPQKIEDAVWNAVTGSGLVVN